MKGNKLTAIMRRRLLRIAIIALMSAAFVALTMFIIYQLSERPAKTMPINKPTVAEQQPEEVYGTDMEIMVDWRAVQAYEIGGKTEIAVEDLEYCGYTIEKNKNRIDAVTYYLENYEPPEIFVGRTDTPIGYTEPDMVEVRINNIFIEADAYESKHYVDVEALGSLTDDYNLETGWSDYNFRNEYLDENLINIECFRFPRVDVPSIVEDKRTLVDGIELELYTEGERITNPRSAYEPANGVLAGINGDGNGDWLHFKKKLFKNTFSVYSNYIEFDDGQLDIYNANKRAIWRKDVLMLVPWNTHDVTLALNNDEYIRAALDTLKRYKRPVVIRYAAEMNVSELGNSPAAYVKAFRHVADIVHEYGFEMMWSVNDMGALNKPYELYYPGDEYVDWVGVSSYPSHDFMHTSPTSETDSILFGCSDYGWHTNNLKYIERFMVQNNIDKPMAISEGAVESHFYYAGAPTDFQSWGEAKIANMYWYLPMRFPNLKMITYFSVEAGDGPVGSELDGNEGYISIVDKALGSGAYKPSYSEDATMSFVEAVNVTYSRGDKIPLYTYAYIPKEDVRSVTYSIDGVRFDEQTAIPYYTELNTKGLTNGEHTLTIDIAGETQYPQMEFKIYVGDTVNIYR